METQLHLLSYMSNDARAHLQCCVCVCVCYWRVFLENFKISSVYLSVENFSFIMFMILSSLMSRHLTQRRFTVLILLLFLISFSEISNIWSFLISYIFSHTFTSMYFYHLYSGKFLQIYLSILLNFGFSFQETLLILWLLIFHCMFFNGCNTFFYSLTEVFFFIEI